MPWFSEAFRRQAESDLAAYEALVPTTLPVSHRLHLLVASIGAALRARAPAISAEVWRGRQRIAVTVELPPLVDERREPPRPATRR